MDSTLHRFISEVALNRIDRPTLSISNIDRSCFLKCKSKKAELSRELLQIPYDTTTSTDASSISSKTSYLDEFINRGQPKQPLKVIKKKQSPFPKYDVLGEFMGNIPRTTSKTQIILQKAVQTTKTLPNQNQTTIRKMIDLKNYAKMRQNKENISQNTPFQNELPKCLKYIEQQTPNRLIDIFEPYNETPQQIKSKQMSSLAPVEQEPSEQEQSPIKESIREKQAIKMRSSYNSIDLSSIQIVDQEEDFELESIILNDLKTDILNLNRKMTSDMPIKIFGTPKRSQNNIEFSYQQLKESIEKLQQRIMRQNRFL